MCWNAWLISAASTQSLTESSLKKTLSVVKPLKPPLDWRLMKDLRLKQPFFLSSTQHNMCDIVPRPPPEGSASADKGVCE